MCKDRDDRVIIAIDGPAGAGKSTIARIVAKKLGLRYIDTGAMYRALTLKAIKTGVKCNDSRALIELLQKSNFVTLFAKRGRQTVIILDGQDVTDEIRLPAVSQKVSKVAMVPAVRRELVKIQREMAAGGGVVMDGRDIGTVVLPDADIKVFLTASLEERAQRRFKEMLLKGHPASLSLIKEQVAERDRLDRQREFSPLQAAPDAICIDTTGYTPAEIASRIIRLCRPERGCS